MDTNHVSVVQDTRHKTHRALRVTVDTDCMNNAFYYSYTKDQFSLSCCCCYGSKLWVIVSDIYFHGYNLTKYKCVRYCDSVMGLSKNTNHLGVKLDILHVCV